MTQPATIAKLPDYEACAREPIHIPGSIQPHGLLFALHPETLSIVHASTNTAELIGLEATALLGSSLIDVLGPDQLESLTPSLMETVNAVEPRFLRIVTLRTKQGERPFETVAHPANGVLIVEFEPCVPTDISFQTLYPVVRTFMNRLKSIKRIAELGELAAEEVRRLTGYDRVLVYKFDPAWNGHVIAESRSDVLPSYMDLWFPAADIPAQARKLYVSNRFRLISNIAYDPAPIVPQTNPATQQPLDLSFAGLRSVSPVHVEYLRNMEVGASMSISIVAEQSQLWGLIACHHATPRQISVETRTACDLIAQSLAVHLQAAEHVEEFEQRLRYNALSRDLLAFMSQEDDFIQGLIRHPNELLEFGEAGGAAVLYDGKCTLIGTTPSQEEVDQLVAWLTEHGQPEVFHSDQLPAEFPEAKSYASIASGVLGIGISKFYPSYILWFRPEVVETVKWGGDPHKLPEERQGVTRIHPRRSFELWKEIVRGTSQAWEPARIEAATGLRNAVVGIVLRKAEELADLSAELQRSNRELESFSYSVSHDLRAPFRHIVGYAELLKKSTGSKFSERDQRFVGNIIESAEFAGTLVDNLLSLSQVARAQLRPRPVDVDKLVQEVLRNVKVATPERKIEWNILPLGSVTADPILFRVVWQNLVDNAVKFTAKRETAVIEIGVDVRPDKAIFHVRDNGVGFEQAYVDKLFGVFQRLHRMEEYEGTGIGLANVRRIMSRHGGDTWAEGKLDQGATFFFSLPYPKEEEATYA